MLFKMPRGFEAPPVLLEFRRELCVADGDPVPSRGLDNQQVVDYAFENGGLYLVQSLFWDSNARPNVAAKPRNKEVLLDLFTINQSEHP
jgi:hypothetical protein